MKKEWRIPTSKVMKLFFGILDEIPVLGRHSIQVAKLSAMLGSEMELPMERIIELYILGGFHDIGLIAPKIRGMEIFEVFEKEKNRSEAIIDVMKDDVVFKEHVDISAKIASTVPMLSNLSGVVGNHHTPAVDLDINLSSIMANIVMMADSISMRLMVRDNVPDDEFVEDVLEHIRTGKILYFPDVREAAKEVIKKEGYMMLVSDNRLHWDEFVGVETSMDAVNFASALAIMDFFVDSKAKRTRHHSTRVAFLSREIGKVMLSEAESFGLFIAGRLHDVGKIFLSTDVIEKASMKDFAYRTHVIHTYNLLSETEAFQSITAWAISHHERLDGSGYPWGLKAEDLSIPARILQVANSYVALVDSGAEDPISKLDECVREGKLDGNVFLVLKDLIDSGYDVSEIYDVVELYMEEVESGERDLEKAH